MRPSIKKRQLHQSAMFTPNYDAILKAYRDYVTDAQERHRNLDLKKRIDTNHLPCELYHAYDRWQPRNGINTLFLAESPPWSGAENYFYNEKYEAPEGRMNLSTILFDKLHIAEGTKERNLTEFRGRDYFLSDTVKCVFRKTLSRNSETNEKKSIPSDLRRLSVDKVLKDEIASMRPDVVFLLGRTALKALRQIEESRTSLQNVTVAKDCGRRISMNNTNVIVCAFLNAQNLQVYGKRIDQAFEELAALQ